MLEVDHIEVGYGPLPVLFDMNLSVGPGEVLALMGRNGMGKTTTVRAIMGLARVSKGTIRLHGVEIANLQPHRVARLGIGLVPEGRRIFPNLSTVENLVAAAHRGTSSSPWTLARIFDLFPALAGRKNLAGTQLSGGEQQMLAIGRALMTSPSLLILDEATEGLAPLARAAIWQCLARLKNEGLSLVVIDRDFHALSALADRCCVMEKGRVAWAGNGVDLARDPTLAQRFLGL